SQSVDIEGPGAKKLAISGNHASRVFDITGGAVTIAGLTITNGLADKNAPILPYGGGILNLAALTLSNDVLSHNQAIGDLSVSPGGCTGCAAGGAIASLSGSLDIADSQFTDNQAIGGA